MWACDWGGLDSTAVGNTSFVIGSCLQSSDLAIGRERAMGAGRQGADVIMVGCMARLEGDALVGVTVASWRRGRVTVVLKNRLIC